jgi:hypothetical protein
VRFDRVLGPDHDHHPGLGDGLLNLSIECGALLNPLAVQPDRQSGLEEHVRQRVGSVRVVFQLGRIANDSHHAGHRGRCRGQDNLRGFVLGIKRGLMAIDASGKAAFILPAFAVRPVGVHHFTQSSARLRAILGRHDFAGPIWRLRPLDCLGHEGVDVEIVFAR